MQLNQINLLGEPYWLAKCGKTNGQLSCLELCLLGLLDNEQTHDVLRQCPGYTILQFVYVANASVVTIYPSKYNDKSST